MIVDAAKQGQADGFIADMNLDIHVVAGEKGFAQVGSVNAYNDCPSILSDPQLFLPMRRLARLTRNPSMSKTRLTTRER